MNKEARIELISVRVTPLNVSPFIIKMMSDKKIKIDINKFFLSIFVEIKNINEPNKNCQNLNNGE